MRHFDTGHRETQVDLPEPLAASGIWSIGTWALPAKTLSLFSVIVFVFIAGVLLSGERMRQLFNLSVHPAWLAVPTALLAWVIVIRCRHRPGRWGPRFWALGLASLTSLIAVVCAWVPDWPLLHVLVVASIASVLTLLPRLIPVHPDSSLVQRVAPLSLLFVLLLIMPTTCHLSNNIVETQQSRISQRILDLGNLTTRLNDMGRYPWAQMMEHPDAAAKNVEWLKAQDFSRFNSDLHLWQAAKVLGRETELVEASTKLIGAVVEGFQPERAPRLSVLPEAANRYDPADRRWEANADFPRLSEITGEYHRELGRLFHELDVEGVSVDYPGLVKVEVFSRDRKTELKERLTALSAAWADGWAAFRIPEVESLIGKERRPLAEVLQASLLNGSQPAMRPADLWELMTLRLSQVRELAGDTAGCQNSRYPDRGKEFYRLDCYSYRPSTENAGADLRVEVRLVYDLTGVPPESDGGLTPVEVFFLFPAGSEMGSVDDLKNEVMAALAVAVKKHWTGRFDYADRSSSATSGFWLYGDGRKLRVMPATDEPYLDGARAVVVRAEWR